MAVSSVSSSSVSMTGLFSNLDTDSLISVLMASDNNNYKTLENRKSDYSSIQSTFQSLNTKLNTLRMAANDLLLKVNLTKTTATSSDTKVLNVSSSSGAAPGTYQIEVQQVAKSHIIRTDDVNASGTTLIDSIKSRVSDGENVAISVDGVSIDVGSLASQAATDKDFLNALKSKINSSSANLSASIIQRSDTTASLVLTTKSTGVANSIKAKEGAFGISGDSDVLSALGLTATQDAEGTYHFKNNVQDAADALLTVNGVDITSSSNTIKGAIENVSLSLVAEGTTTVTVGTDTSAVADMMQAFVDAYNDVVDAVNAAKAFQDSNSRTPLQTDSTLNSLLSNLGNWMNSRAGVAEDGTDNLSLQYFYQIGLEVDKGATTPSEMTGKISFDRDQFIEALQEDPDGVYQLLSYNEDGASKGLARVFSDNLYSWTSPTNGIIKTKIDGYDSEISFISDEMEQLKARLDVKEASLKQKFVNMETALSTLQSQQSWLNGVVESMTASKSKS